MTRYVLAVLAGAAVACPILALADPPVTVVQQGRAFLVKDVSIIRGTTVRFSNADDFPHQVSVSGPGMAYDSDLQQPGSDLEVPFPAHGTFEVHCGIHPRMRMTIRVEQRP